MRRVLCRSLLGIVVMHGCGDDGSPAEGTTGAATTGSSSSSSSSSTGDDTSTSTGGESSTTMAPDDDTGTPINCGPQVCAPELVCVREETVVGSTSTGEPGTGTGTGTGTDTGTGGGAGGGGGEMMVEWFCRGRPDECTATADCACAAVLCPAASCECVDEADNSIACVPGPSC